MHTEHTPVSREHTVPAAMPASQLAITGMTCTNCARHVTEAIQSVSGVRSASVSLETKQAAVHWTPGSEPDVAAVIRAVEGEGYGAKALEDHAHEHAHGERSFAGWQINLWIGVLGTVPLMMGEWILGLGLTPWFRWVSLVLAGVVQVIAGTPFYRGAWNQLKVGSSNMDTLVALGSTTAFAYSVWALVGAPGSHLYFLEAAAIITLISVGHWLEARVSARASSALRQLLRLAPQTARRLDLTGSSLPVSSSPHEPTLTRPSAILSPPVGVELRGDVGFSLNSTAPTRDLGVLKATYEPGHGTPAVSHETEVPVAELKIGDLVALRPGDHVPTDGHVVEGDSAVDESMLTGESVPVDKTAGSPVYAGTVNLNGRLVMRVTATGDATALAHIIAAVQRAQTSRANIQRLGDRVSSVFVPVVVAIAVARRTVVGPGARLRQTGSRLARAVSLAGAHAADGAGRGIHHRGGRADHRLSLRHGPGHAGRHHGRLQRRRPARHPHPRRCGAGESRAHHGGSFRQDRDADGREAESGEGLGSQRQPGRPACAHPGHGTK